MFLKKYVSDFYFNQILETYEKNYLNTLDENNFIKIYNLLRKYNFYFIDSIVLKYLELFYLDYEKVEKSLINLKNKLGNNFVFLIGEDMTYLNHIIDSEI